jgi:hypothetical protein
MELTLTFPLSQAALLHSCVFYVKLLKSPRGDKEKNPVHMGYLNLEMVYSSYCDFVG